MADLEIPRRRPPRPATAAEPGFSDHVVQHRRRGVRRSDDRAGRAADARRRRRIRPGRPDPAAAIYFWFFLPWMVITPVGGWLADTLPRKWIITRLRRGAGGAAAHRGDHGAGRDHGRGVQPHPYSRAAPGVEGLRRARGRRALYAAIFGPTLARDDPADRHPEPAQPRQLRHPRHRRHRLAHRLHHRRVAHRLVLRPHRHHRRPALLRRHRHVLGLHPPPAAHRARARPRAWRVHPHGPRGVQYIRRHGGRAAAGPAQRPALVDRHDRRPDDRRGYYQARLPSYKKIT